MTDPIASCLAAAGETDWAANEEEPHPYDFRFLTDDQYGSQAKWFPVEKILDFDDLTDVYDYLAQQDLHSEKSAFKRLGKLHSTVHSDDVIAYYEEKDQDVDKVLQIFIRTNSGGTVLSYSDLLLSIATATWTRSMHGRKSTNW